MDSETIDILYRSRKTLLTILAENGYNTTPFETFGPWEIEKMVSNGEKTLRMDLTTGIEGDPRTCTVLYSFARIKQRIQTFLTENIFEPAESSGEEPDYSSTEVYVMTVEPIGEIFHSAALSIYTKEKLRVGFFQVHSLVIDPRKHALVPKHERITGDEEAEIRKRFHIRSKTNLPIIKFHEDMQARLMFLRPGEIVKITRGSPSAGEYVVYRLCAP